MINRADLFQGGGKVEIVGSDYELSALNYIRRKPGDTLSGQISIVLRELSTGEEIALNFHGVCLGACLEFPGPDNLEIINEHWQQWEGREQFGVWLVAEDGSRERLFGAARME
jgi:hypothetical protein